MTSISQTTIVGEFAPITGLRDEDMDIDMIATYNTAMTDVAVTDV